MGSLFTIFDGCTCNTTIHEEIKQIKNNHLKHLDEKIDKVDTKINNLQHNIVQIMTHIEIIPLHP